MDGKVKGTTGALTLEMARIEELKMLPSNAKIHSQKHIDKIVKSIKEFGFKQLILITTDSFIIAGHCRYAVGKKLEYKLKKPFDVLVDLDYRSNWLATVDNVKTKILLLNEEIFIPELAL